MSVTAPPSVDVLPPAPSTSAPSIFNALMDAWLAAMPNFRAQLVALVANAFGNATDAASSATASATSAAQSSSSASLSSIYAGQSAASSNFKGSWSSLTGAAAVPYSVYYNNCYWLLLSNIADITAKTPGVAAEWAPIMFAPAAKFSIERAERRARQSTFS